MSTFHAGAGASTTMKTSPSQSQSSPAEWDEHDEADITTAGPTATEILPVRVPLERVEIGRWKYVGTELNDLELLYDLKSSGLYIKCGVKGSGGVAPPATYRVSDISAADLSLATVIPGSLESIVARLVLETEEPIECSLCTSDVNEEGGEKPSNPEQVSSDSSTESMADVRDSSHGRDGAGKEGKTVMMVHSHIVAMTASVHEAGHLRDILLFLKGGYAGKVSPDTLFLNPRLSQGTQEETDTPLEKNSESEPPVDGLTNSDSNHITFLESLPVWVQYVPWWVYSRNVRISIQNILFVYSLFSVMWAFWQLYRNVNVIQIVLEPIVAAMKEVYLASLIEAFDWCLARFTEFWMRFLSPLNILQGLLLAPVLQGLMQLWTIFLPLARVLYSVALAVWQCLPNTQLLASLKSIFWVLHVIACAVGQNLWLLVTQLMKPVHLIWQGVLNSRIAVGSLDQNRLQFSWVVNLIMGSFRAIGNGTAKLCGYTSRRRKLLRAKRHPSQYLSPPRRLSSANPRTPVYYSSPLTKED